MSKSNQPSQSEQPNGGLSRRNFLSIMGSSSAAAMLSSYAPGLIARPNLSAPSPEPLNINFSMTADEAMQRLIDGNERYVAAKAEHPDQTSERRVEVAKGQHPFAVIVSCVDSRVPPEIVFDQGLGDLFVIRTAAGVLGNDVVIGSIEFGVAEFGIPLIVVLGHERCGAVAATVTAVTKGGHAEGKIGSVVEAITPAVKKAQKMAGTDLVDDAVRANAVMISQALKATGPILQEAFKAGKLNIVAARYDLDDGTVDLLKEA